MSLNLLIFLFICNNIYKIILLSFEFKSIHCIQFEHACIGIMKFLCTCVLEMYTLYMNRVVSPSPPHSTLCNETKTLNVRCLVLSFPSIHHPSIYFSSFINSSSIHPFIFYPSSIHLQSIHSFFIHHQFILASNHPSIIHPSLIHSCIFHPCIVFLT